MNKSSVYKANFKSVFLFYKPKPLFSACGCNEHGSSDIVCSEEGKCTCKDNYAGDKCDECIEGFFGFPNCQGCTCNDQGSENAVCDTSGKCTCKANIEGNSCDQCVTAFYGFPNCQGTQFRVYFYQSNLRTKFRFQLVNVTPRDQRQPIHAMSPENVLANPTLLETSVTNVQKVSA